MRDISSQGRQVSPRSRRLEVMETRGGEGVACLSRAPRSFLCRYVQAPATQVKPEDKSVIKKTATETCEINALKRSRPRSNDATATRTWLKSEFAFWLSVFISVIHTHLLCQMYGKLEFEFQGTIFNFSKSN